MAAIKKLTPAGLQVERAVEMGFDIAACNLYYANQKDDVPMVEGDQPNEVSVWPGWHRMIQARAGTDKAPLMGEELATEEADSLNPTGDECDEYIEDRIEELS